MHRRPLLIVIILPINSLARTPIDHTLRDPPRRLASYDPLHILSAKLLFPAPPGNLRNAHVLVVGPGVVLHQPSDAAEESFGTRVCPTLGARYVDDFAIDAYDGRISRVDWGVHLVS